MPSTKLTLSVDSSIVESAKRMAAERGTSVSAMFARLLTALERINLADEPPLAPIARKVSGVVTLPAGKSDSEILEAALAERAGGNA